MSLYSDIYSKKLYENEKNILFWENYLQNLNKLNFDQYSNKLKVPSLIPVGSRMLFRGELKHTNEVTVSLGAEYFVKCSVNQAEVLRTHRIKDAESRINLIRKERQYLESQISFEKNNLLEYPGQEIVEVHTPEEDEIWRKKHRENVKQYMKKKTKDKNVNVRLSDDDLWLRLEELELQEELEGELNKENCNPNHLDKFLTSKSDNKLESSTNDTRNEYLDRPKDSSNLNLLQQILDKQQNLEQKLLEIKNKEFDKSKTESDISSKLDELEHLEELEDEMERIDNIININNPDEEEIKVTKTDSKKSITFADEDESETLEITFKHSDTVPNLNCYDKTKGIIKPSDLYEAFPNVNNETTSILKKSTTSQPIYDYENLSAIKNVEYSEKPTIKIRDVVEKKIKKECKTSDFDNKPVSLFKQKRLLKK